MRQADPDRYPAILIEAQADCAAGAYLAGAVAAVDQPGTSGPLPATMQAWGLEGTPTLVLIDRLGRMRARHFGQVPDMALGAQIVDLLREADA